jgi:alkane 1-monooxygenase
MLRELKYTLGIIVPIVVLISLILNGWWSYFALIFAFGFIPLMELFLPQSEVNMSKEEESTVKHERFFDWLLYINVPIQYGLLIYFLIVVTGGGLEVYEIIGKTLSMGAACAVLGINVAHELGHRHKKSEQLMSKALLLTSLYMHFFIEHNRGHHKNIATPLDPATSRYGENIYSFFIRTVRDSYKSAWRLENGRLRKKGLPVLSWQNEMVRFQVIQVLFTAAIFIIFGWVGGLAFIGAAIYGFLMLETVNYIEHYGLERKEIRDGVYEKCQPWHSWNSNHPLGRILLYELTRHSDHHFHSGRKYQVLRHFDESPQMPTGYPGMMLVALVPPLWFRIMHRHIDNYSEQFPELRAAA